MLGLLVVAILLSWGKFLWDIEARNLWVGCFPDKTYLACFNRQNIGYTSLGFFIYPITIGWIYSFILLVPVLILEASCILKKVQLP
jgi:hypothetical protein